MKKVLLTSVSVLAISAGAAFAQSPNGAPSGWLTQPSAVTPVSPAGAVSPGNTSIVGQNGSGNQIGTSSNWGVDQSVDGSSGNYSNIQQGSSISTSTGAKATVSQTSTSGGGSTTSTVIQDDGSSTAAGGNEAYTTQVASAGGGLVQSSIQQVGDNLKANVDQSVAGSAASLIDQSGSGGSVNVYQRSVGASSQVHQSGTGNATATSFADLAGVYNVNVNQTGYATNNSYVSQTNLAPAGSVTINQGGDWPSTGTNNSVVSQSSGTGSVTINQGVDSSGYYNYSNNNSGVFQSGSGGSVEVNQSGAAGLLNTSSVVQSSTTADTSATVTQNGWGAGYNTSYVWQQGGGTEIGNVTQTNNGSFENLSNLSQAGAATAYVNQTSSVAQNTSTITQTGGLAVAVNVAYVHQH